MYCLVRAAQLRLLPGTRTSRRRSTSEASPGDRDLARQQTLTLLTATRHVDISEAAVLADLLLDPQTRTG